MNPGCQNLCRRSQALTQGGARLDDELALEIRANTWRVSNETRIGGRIVVLCGACLPSKLAPNPDVPQTVD